MIAVVNDNLLADLFLFQNAGNGFQNIFFLRLVNMPVFIGAGQNLRPEFPGARRKAKNRQKRKK
jgi:hypothetical protein